MAYQLAVDIIKKENFKRPMKKSKVFDSKKSLGIISIAILYGQMTYNSDS